MVLVLILAELLYYFNNESSTPYILKVLFFKRLAIKTTLKVLFFLCDIKYSAVLDLI